MNILELPTKILENIFANFLPKHQDKSLEKKAKIGELLKCTEVCKLFNVVIGQSDRLMSEILVLWDEDKDPKPMLTSSRSYRNLTRFRGTMLSLAFSHFLQTQPKIACLWLPIFRDFPSSELWVIIDLVKNSLRELSVINIKLKDDDAFLPIHAPNLRSLNLGCSHSIEKDKIFCLFENNENLEEFRFGVDQRTSPEIIRKVESFLCNNERLKYLDLTGESSITFMFNSSNFAERANFQLEVLILDLSPGISSQLVNFVPFLKKQRCLKTLSLSNITLTNAMLSAILNHKTLKDLSLEEFNPEIVRNLHARSSSIESLSFSQLLSHNFDNLEWRSGVYEIIKGCPAVRKLGLFFINFTELIANHVVEHQKKLEELEIYVHNELHPIYIPTVRTLNLKARSATSDFDVNGRNFLEFIRLNPQLKKIKAYNWLKNYPISTDLSSVAQSRLEYYNPFRP